MLWSGIFIKLGQHIASLVVLPVEWTTTMKVLQDQCEPTRIEDLEKLFLKDMGSPIEEIFDEFDPIPIGTASLAQVHTGYYKQSGKRVAVKVRSLIPIFRGQLFGSTLRLYIAPTSPSCRILRH